MDDRRPDPFDDDWPPDVEGDCPACGGTGEVCCSCGGDCELCCDGMRTCQGCGGSGWREPVPPYDDEDW